MIAYNPKNWLNLIFSYSKSDTIRMLWRQILYIALLSTVITFIEINFFPKAEFLKHLIAVYSLLGFVISLLLVFRTNTAYDRWWEGRKLWGAIVNDSRNLASKISSMELQAEDKNHLKNLIVNFCYASMQYLRDSNSNENLTFQSEEELRKFLKSSHKPMFIMNQIRNKINYLKHAGYLSDTTILLLDKNINSLVDSLGGCERIKNTPIPYSYSLFIKKFIFIYVITLPLAFVNQFGYLSGLIATFVFYALVSMEVLAEEIEDPFGDDDNDLPAEQICERIKENINEIFLD